MTPASTYTAMRRDALEAKMTTAGRIQKGVRFPKSFFQTGSAAQRVATFDAAYDLACHHLGVSFVDVLEEEDTLRFLPSLSSIG